MRQLSPSRQLIDFAAQFPPVRALLRSRYARAFRTPRGTGAWYGAFDSFADASAAAPPVLPVGYDNAGGATIYDDVATRVGAVDYPVLYWLQRILDRGSALFDVGGHTGMLYYAYHPYLPTGSGICWEVYDVPAVVELGAARARPFDGTQLSFTSDFSRAAGADVLLASGSLQYIETPFASLLRGLDRLPPKLIVNKLPTQEHRDVITLQNIGVAYCPYRLSAHRGFCESLEGLGYTLVDQWVNPEERDRLPYNDSASPVTWRGYYFRRGSGPTSV